LAVIAGVGAAQENPFAVQAEKSLLDPKIAKPAAHGRFIGTIQPRRHPIQVRINFKSQRRWPSTCRLASDQRVSGK